MMDFNTYRGFFYGKNGSNPPHIREKYNFKSLDFYYRFQLPAGSQNMKGFSF
jgi:hypothetical protein